MNEILPYFSKILKSVPRVLTRQIKACAAVGQLGKGSRALDEPRRLRYAAYDQGSRGIFGLFHGRISP